MNNRQSLNISVLQAYASSPEDVKLFSDVFIRQTAADIEALGHACADGPNRAWLELCHKIKGAAAMAGADALYALCSTAEELIDVSGERRRAMLTELEAAFTEVSDKLRSLSA